MVRAWSRGISNGRGFTWRGGLKGSFRAQAPKTGFLTKLKSLGNVLVTGVEGADVKVGL